MTDPDRIAQREQEVTDLQERLNSARDLINYIVRREHVTREVYDGAMRWLANVPEVPKTVRVEDRAHDPRPCAVCGHSELEFTTLNTERDTLHAELAGVVRALQKIGAYVAKAIEKDAQEFLSGGDILTIVNGALNNLPAAARALLDEVEKLRDDNKRLLLEVADKIKAGLIVVEANAKLLDELARVKLECGEHLRMRAFAVEELSLANDKIHQLDGEINLVAYFMGAERLQHETQNEKLIRYEGFLRNFTDDDWRKATLRIISTPQGDSHDR